MTLWDITGRAEPVQWAVLRSAGKRQTLKGFQLHSLGSKWVSLADPLCIDLMIPMHGFGPAAFFFLRAFYMLLTPSTTHCTNSFHLAVPHL